MYRYVESKDDIDEEMANSKKCGLEEEVVKNG